MAVAVSVLLLRCGRSICFVFPVSRGWGRGGTANGRLAVTWSGITPSSIFVATSSSGVIVTSVGTVVVMGSIVVPAIIIFAFGRVRSSIGTVVFTKKRRHHVSTSGWWLMWPWDMFCADSVLRVD